jgi:predicted ArsR family transcriptional regulator
VTRPNLDDTLSAIGLLDERVRRDLYEWVVAQDRPVGREEAARATGISRALAAFHLDRLAAAGLLTAGYRRLTGRVGPGAGRPARVYERSREEFAVSLPERRYERAAELFALALERAGDGTPPRSLTQAAETLGEELGSATRRRAPERRLLSALQAGGYEPVSDATGTIRLRNCPFDTLVADHRDLVCGTNLAMAEGIVRGAGSPMRPVLDPQPGRCCVAFTPPG